MQLEKQIKIAKHLLSLATEKANTVDIESDDFRHWSMKQGSLEGWLKVAEKTEPRRPLKTVITTGEWHIKPDNFIDIYREMEKENGRN